MVGEHEFGCKRFYSGRQRILHEGDYFSYKGNSPQLFNFINLTLRLGIRKLHVTPVLV